MMHKIIRISKLILFPTLGILILYILFKDRNFDEIANSLKYDFNYWWIGISLIFGIFSHLVRAVRWQMLIATEGKKPRLINTFGAVLTGYLANLILPRMGEVSKCGVISKYEHVSFVRIAGTVIIERLADLIGMLTLLALVFLLEFDLIVTLVHQTLTIPTIPQLLTSYAFWGIIVLAILLAYIAYRFIKKSFLMKLENLWVKFKDGIQSFNKLNNKPLFILLSAAIWFFYFMMLYVTFFAMEATSHLSPTAGLTILITGSLGMLAPIQGGMGAWHFMVIQSLVLYGVSEDVAGNFALVVHSSQNILVIALGLISFILLPLFNTKNQPTQ